MQSVTILDNAATDLGVPLKLTYYVEHDKDKETQFERTPVAKVYEQIVKDLKESVDCFTKSPQTKVLPGLLRVLLYYC